MSRTEVEARRAAESPWSQHVGRTGWAARAVVYTVTAGLALQVAMGHRPKGGRADQTGALQAIAATPVGAVLLAVLTAGLVCFAAGRLAEIVNEDSDGPKLWAKRVSYASSGISQLVLATLAGGLLLHRHRSRPSGAKEQGVTARVLGWPHGRLIVVVIAVVVIGFGIGFIVQGLRRRFVRHLEQRKLSASARRTAEVVGLAGHAARGVVYGLIGLFLIDAARRFDPHRAVGLDGALRRLAARPWGPLMLVVVAAGLLCFAAYCALMAKYREITPKET